ncbi:F0F1 ATP synthase subunit A [Candidatus Gracilibacteria bacterium]|nr:F0F1 ATP synthase subunit A [Candidatus Gracilibacteria bacterium]
MNVFFEQFASVFLHPGVIVGLGVELALFALLAFAYQKYKENSFVVFFEMFFEKAYEFFEDILGIEEKKWTKIYITSLFFIILLSNLLGVFLELLLPIFGHGLEHWIKIPTADINFNVAMAVVGVIIVLYEQFAFLGFGKTMYEYFPILGKDYIPFQRGNLPSYIDLPVFLLVKIFDIIISVFLGLLEIVGHAAKIISLSFRLFGNVTSGGILLAMLIGALSALSTSLVGFDFPVLGPIILYLQELLVAFIQALVFPLLIAIFIKVAKVH